MLEHGLAELTARVPEQAELHPAPSIASLTFRRIFSGVPAKGGALLEQYARLAALACVLALLLPLLLVVTVLSLVVARVLGVPLFAPTSFRPGNR